MIGKILGDRYRLTGTLGSGAMGDVYLAEHVVLGKKMAVKVLKQIFCTNETVMQRFQQEAIAASRIGHENIVSVTDFGRTDDGALYFVMEALEGESLGALVGRSGGLALERAVPILLQVCRALIAAHARGIVHRDLKLDNVVLVRRDDGGDLAKVLDFGISKVSAQSGGGVDHHATQAGTLLGTPDYMSPEQIRGEDVDHRADIYAFGVLAYELVIGAVPFVAKNAVDVMMKHLTGVPQPPSRARPDLHLPSAFDALVLRALEKDREKRFQSMTEVRAALAGCLEAIGVVPELTPPQPFPVRAMATPEFGSGLDDTLTPLRAAQAKATLGSKPAGRKLPWLAVGALGLLAAGAGSWWALTQQRVPPPLVLPAAAPQMPTLTPLAAPPTPALPVAAPTPALPVAAPTPALPVAPPTPTLPVAAPTPTLPVAASTPTLPVAAPPTPTPVAARTPVTPLPPPPPPRPPPLPARLEVREVARVFGQAQGGLRKCLLDHRAQLPSTAGRLELSFTVLASGVVSTAAVKTSVDAKIADCVVSRVVKLRFPAHVLATQTFDLPLDYALNQ